MRDRCGAVFLFGKEAVRQRCGVEKVRLVGYSLGYEKSFDSHTAKAF